MRCFILTIAVVFLGSVSAIGLSDVPPTGEPPGTPADLAAQGVPDSSSGAEMVEAIEAGSQAGSKREGEFVVVPLPFRNALIGAGLVVGAGYLYRSADAPDKGPPSIAGVGGMYAENDTWAALAAHRGYWAKDTWRTTTGVVTGKVNYQLTLGEGSLEQKVSVTQPVSAASIEGTRRFGKHTWIGMSLGYARTDVTAVGLLVADDIELADFAVSAEWDTRDDTFAPSKGLFVTLDVKQFDEAIGSDFDFTRVDFSVNGYRALAPRHTLAWRGAYQHATDDAPFFAMPWLGSGCDIRGYTPGEYVGGTLLAAQAEWRFQMTPRWGLVAFGGIASVSDREGEFKSGDSLPAGGFGVRYRVADKFKVNVRADMAWGRDDKTFTLSVGEAF